MKFARVPWVLGALLLAAPMLPRHALAQASAMGGAGSSQTVTIRALVVMANPTSHLLEVRDASGAPLFVTYDPTISGAERLKQGDVIVLHYHQAVSFGTVRPRHAAAARFADHQVENLSARRGRSDDRRACAAGGDGPRRWCRPFGEYDLAGTAGRRPCRGAAGNRPTDAGAPPQRKSGRHANGDLYARRGGGDRTRAVMFTAECAATRIPPYRGVTKLLGI